MKMIMTCDSEKIQKHVHFIFVSFKLFRFIFKLSILLCVYYSGMSTLKKGFILQSCSDEKQKHVALTTTQKEVIFKKNWKTVQLLNILLILMALE